MRATTQLHVNIGKFIIQNIYKFSCAKEVYYTMLEKPFLVKDSIGIISKTHHSRHRTTQEAPMTLSGSDKRRQKELKENCLSEKNRYFCHQKELFVSTATTNGSKSRYDVISCKPETPQQM